MTLNEAVLQKRAKESESKELENFPFNSAYIHVLDTLLRDAHACLRPRPADYVIRKDLVQFFDWLAKQIPGSANGFPIVEVFGSFAMDLFTTKSDLDISVNLSHEPNELPRDRKIWILRKLARIFYSLRDQGHVSTVQPIMSARVPIVKIVDRGTGIECDISVENKDGVAKSRILTIIFSIDERFRLLSFLMKAWAKAHDINSSKERTLNSLSLVSLVAFHLQSRSPPILPPFSTLLRDGHDVASVENIARRFQHYGRANRESLAELFVSLLTKLSSVETLWTDGLCASTYEGSWILKKWESQDGNISVEDFLDRSQNIARAVGTVEMKKIYMCIHRSVYRILSFMRGYVQAPELKRFLFGKDAVQQLELDTRYSETYRKRSFPFDDSIGPQLDPYPSKMVRYDESYGMIPNVDVPRLPPIRQFSYDRSQASAGLEQPLFGFDEAYPVDLQYPAPYTEPRQYASYQSVEGKFPPFYP
ncbi:protein HESO1-like [Aristolochia californica]|uniref:protein HESO1-like n=1 Tax=Aristolochia californica TaxID=171875 RepID=UPI0035D568A2